MAWQRNSDAGRRAVTLLATAFVILIGAASTAMTVYVAAEQGGWQAWCAWGTIFLVVIWLVWTLWDSRERSITWLKLWSRTRPEACDPLETYRPRLRRYRPEQPWGSNRPPTLEELRALAEESNTTWIPHAVPPRRPRGQTSDS
ncbi:MAG: hypothetical protein KatS3mg114_0039 [Planctomycetaceae bacterium]|nr:MAG: hypothetical protein KatS3mg114_0039 [Planctomycetaceae bacterium]